MSSALEAYMNLAKEQRISQIEKEIIVSKRVKDSNGNPIKWKIKAMTDEQYDALLEKHKTNQIVNGELVEKFNRVSWQSELIVESVIDPDLRNDKLCTAYGTHDPIEAIRKMLTPGEYLNLVKQVLAINGYYENYNDDEILNVAKK